MSNPDFITVTRSLVKRGWSDFEPKVISGLLTGSIAAFVISILTSYGIHLTALQQNYICIGFYFLGSYATPSAGTTVTTNHSTGIGASVEKSETHSGNAVSVVTASTPIQRPGVDESGSVYTVEPVPIAKKYDSFLAGLPSSQDDNATRVLD